ncbi:MAG: PLP-dependent transferase [Nitrospinae bacterium]|nr:PLP-dependent transferase [Nitrospinota bacterium]
MKISTRAVHHGKEPNELTGAVKPDICLSSTFKQHTPGDPVGDYEYSRSGNPTREALEQNIAGLERPEGADTECHGLAFSSGLGATTTILFALLSHGDHMLCSDDVYGGTFRLITGKDFRGFEKFGVACDYVDMADEESLAGKIRENTRLIWIESPTNPLLKMADIQSITATYGSDGVIIAVDNTFMSPYFQRPLALGADIAVHSTTKYIGGHSDVVGGALVTKSRALHERIKHYQNALGATPAPFDCYMTMRGIDTLPVRMEKHQENAMKIAGFLEEHGGVEKVIYPGLASHPQHELAKKQMSGFGGMLAFYLKGGLPEARRFLENVRLFTLAESLGGTESLVEHPAIMTHASLTEESREALGISDTLIRLSVGIEDADDLIEDLEQALKA